MFQWCFIIEFWVKMTLHIFTFKMTLHIFMIEMTLHIFTFAMTLHIFSLQWLYTFVRLKWWHSSFFTVLTFQTRIWPLVSAEAKVSLSATCLKVGDRFHRICNTEARCSSRHWKQIKIILLLKFLCSFGFGTNQNGVSFTLAITERNNFSSQTRACK